MTKIVCLSDTHGQHWQIDVPPGDILIHAGDFCSGRGSLAQVADFNRWLGTLPHTHKVVIAGNHDFPLQDKPTCARLIQNAHYLRDSSVVLEGYKIYGSPWQPTFHNWAFNLPRGGAELSAKWDAIPDDTDILVTHGPPAGICDLTTTGESVGCAALRRRTENIPGLFLHVFGHIHEARGVCGDEQPWRINASIVDEQYDLSKWRGPIVFNMPAFWGGRVFGKEGDVS